MIHPAAADDVSYATSSPKGKDAMKRNLFSRSIRARFFSHLLHVLCMHQDPMNTTSEKGFHTLFRTYRLKSEIETLVEFGNLLADEGYVMETSIFTRWQTGERIPRDRKLLLTVIHIYIKRGGIHTIDEANMFLESAGHGYLTHQETYDICTRLNMKTVTTFMQR